MAQADLCSAVAPFPERFNLCTYYLDRSLDEGRGRRVALIAGKEMRTYAEIAARTGKVAAALRRAGVRPEERVLLVLPDRFEFAESFFGILRAGGVFAMVNPLLKREEYAYYLAYSKARLAIVHAEVLAEFGPAAREARLLKQVLVVGDVGGDIAGGFTSYEQALAAERDGSSEAECEPTGPDDLAGWLFTSGSTGKPKACVHTHADFAWSTETYALQIVRYAESDRCLSVPKLFFGYATGTNLMFPFRVGASSILFEGRSTADELFDQIAAHRPTLLTSVPTMINAMLRSPRMKTADLKSLRVCLSAGEALPPKLYQEWRSRTGVEILDGIGSAEMFHIYISNRLGDVKEASLGQIVPGYEAVVVGEDGKEVPTGEPGLLRVRGGSTALCYWADKAKSRATFQGEWCTSADLFHRDAEGYYFYEGRADDLLKVSGIFTSPLEIENALLEHPAVAEVCVCGHDDEEGLTKPFAFVVLKEGKRGSDALALELKAWIKTKLAPHKYPRWFEWRESLPKNDRGKVARKELKEELEPLTSERPCA
ncbi:MAG: benzoate-CoA ligase family protein, partial [Planctomycetes bacterium]|nr:benzoate-CoA ligase family protein [Planctomycetota bacterium]